jgi:hypothetical protein
MSRINFLKKTIPQKEQEVREMETLKQEYLAARKNAAVLPANSSESESIFSLVERVAKVRGLAENISSIKPVTSSTPARADASAKEEFREVSVEMRMKGLSLQNLVSYLYTLESPPYNLSTKDIQIIPAKDKMSVEVTFTASRLEPR